MNINTLINEISEIFKDEDTVIIYTYDGQIYIYADEFSNTRIRRIWQIIQQERITITINANKNKKAVMQLVIDEE